MNNPDASHPHTVDPAASRFGPEWIPEPVRPPQPVILEPFDSRRAIPTPTPFRPREYRPSLAWALFLFVLTVLSTWATGGWIYSLSIMTILLCHEMGHFLQARRWRVTTSYPLFIPMPFSPIGTMGAVILMRSNIPNRKALFDIGITGPLAGLVPALIACVIGISTSEVIDKSQLMGGAYLELGEPLVFKLLVWLIKGPLPESKDLVLNGVALAGWVGIFITALNLTPVSQLDGGHVLYALLGRRSYGVARILVLVAVVAIVATESWAWLVPLMIVFLIGVVHPPTQNDAIGPDGFRRVLGWATLMFFVVGFTPDPIQLRFESPTRFPPGSADTSDIVRGNDWGAQEVSGLVSLFEKEIGGPVAFDLVRLTPRLAGVDKVEDGERIVECVSNDWRENAITDGVSNSVAETEGKGEQRIQGGERVGQHEENGGKENGHRLIHQPCEPLLQEDANEQLLSNSSRKCNQQHV